MSNVKVFSRMSGKIIAISPKAHINLANNTRSNVAGGEAMVLRRSEDRKLDEDIAFGSLDFYLGNPKNRARRFFKY